VGIRLVSRSRCTHGPASRPGPPSRQSNRGPRTVGHEIPLSLSVDPGQMDRTFALDVRDHFRHRLFRWGHDEHVHVMRHQVPFLNPALVPLTNSALFLRRSYLPKRPPASPVVRKRTSGRRADRRMLHYRSEPICPSLMSAMRGPSIHHGVWAKVRSWPNPAMASPPRQVRCCRTAPSGSPLANSALVLNRGSDKRF